MTLVELPVELLLEILVHLDSGTLGQVTGVCRLLRDACHDDSLWMQKCADEYGMRRRWEVDWKGTFRLLRSPPSIPSTALRLLFLIGTGPFKSIFAGRFQTHPSAPPRLVAVHVYRQNSAAAAREKELRIWRRLRHPHVCKLIAVVEPQDPSAEAASSFSISMDQFEARSSPIQVFVDDPHALSGHSTAHPSDEAAFSQELVDYISQAGQRNFFSLTKPNCSYSHAAVCELFFGDLLTLLHAHGIANAAAPAMPSSATTPSSSHSSPPSPSIPISHSLPSPPPWGQQTHCPLTVANALRLFREISSALSFMHTLRPPVLMRSLAPTKCYCYTAPTPSGVVEWHAKLGGFYEAEEATTGRTLTPVGDIRALRRMMSSVFQEFLHDPHIKPVERVLSPLLEQDSTTLPEFLHTLDRLIVQLSEDSIIP